MNSDNTVRILLVDDHELFRAGVRSVLERQPGLTVVAEAGDGSCALGLADRLRPNLIFMDISMPGMSGIEATRQIIAARAGCRILALSMHSDRQFIVAAFEAGAHGYLLKNSSPEELGEAIRCVQGGRRYLSPGVIEALGGKAPGPGAENELRLRPREREVLQLLAEGLSNKEVAARLGISVKTVEVHRAQIMSRLGIRTVAGLTKYALRHGLTSIEK
jgi:DNA-binding NarL/FixJ family response regulator